MKRRFWMLIVVLMCVLAVLPGCTYHSEQPWRDPGGMAHRHGQWECRYDEEGTLYLHNEEMDQSITSSYEVMPDGTLQAQDLEKYCEVLNQYAPPVTYEKKPGDSVMGTKATMVEYSYLEKNRSTRIGDGLVMCSDMTARFEDIVITITEGVTITHSFGTEVAVTGKIKEVISAGASFAWNVSLVSEVLASAEFIVPKGKIGHLEFTPYYDVTSGTLTEIINSEYGTEVNEYPATGECPQKTVTGFARGVYDVVIIGNV